MIEVAQNKITTHINIQEKTINVDHTNFLLEI